MDITAFIKPELLALTPILYAVGTWIKKSKKIKNQLIPYILVVVSAVICATYCVAFGNGDVVERVVVGIGQGILLAAATVGGHQCLKQVADLYKQDMENIEGDDS